MELVEDIYSNLDIGLSTSIYRSKKAFDTINHSILINKLYRYVIRGIALKWIANYLSNRKQYVVYNGDICCI